jgi:hypothetical protein
MIQGELQDICSTNLFIETHSTVGFIVLAGDLNIVFSRKDFNDKHFIFCSHKKSGMKIPPGLRNLLLKFK